MSELRIVSVGDRDDAVLHQPAMRVREFGPGLHQLLDQMLETLRGAAGVGLAAPQIGLGQRIAVIEYPDDEDRPEETKRIYELINPEIIKAKGSEVAQEGCLSIPGMAADVDRATQLIVRAQDRNGNEVRYKVYDWLARIFQHEIDHLHGVMMTERATQVYKLVRNADGEIEAIPIEETLSSS
jgi:peptide deformylase